MDLVLGLLGDLSYFLPRDLLEEFGEEDSIAEILVQIIDSGPDGK